MSLYVQGKYIVGEIRSNTSIVDCISAVLFNCLVTHSDLANAFSEIHGAGFFYLDKERKVHVYGESVSLSKKSRPEDVQWIERTLCLTNGE